MPGWDGDVEEVASNYHEVWKEEGRKEVDQPERLFLLVEEEEEESRP